MAGGRRYAPPMPERPRLRLAAIGGAPAPAPPPDDGLRLSPEALGALRELCVLARGVTRDRLLMGGLEADPALAAAVRRLAGFRP